MENSNVISYLFETKAIKFCEENKPFWYTSGKIGPYFINAQYVYGSESEADELLAFITEEMKDRLTIPGKIFDKVLKQYNENEIYKNTIDAMVNAIKQKVDVSEIDYVSGGERRDWFFSNIIAYLLHKPHVTIFKDSETYVSDYNFEKTEKVERIENKNFLHAADIITVASSYTTKWIPAVKALGSNIKWSLSVIDRMQGGAKNLKDNGVDSISLAFVDASLFDKAFEYAIITKPQLEMLHKFIDDPDGTMREFLIAHPEFLENSLKADEKTKLRAQTCIDNDFYNLK